MGRIVKLLGIVIAGVVVLIVAATLLVGFFFDPNDYKDQITQAVADSTGRELTLEGDLELGLFPTIRIAVGSASLSNAAGFGDEPFASIDAAELELELLPLLSRRIEVGEARLVGLELNLARNAAGTGNWEDLASSGETATEADPGPDAGAGGAEISLDVGAVEIVDANVHWSDATTGAEWALENFGFEASSFGEDVEFPLAMGFDLTGEEVHVRVDAEMEATLSLDSNTYRLEDLVVELQGDGAGWPGGEGEANVSFDAFVADLDAETVALENLELEMLGMNISGTLSGQNLISDLSLTGGIEIATFDPQELLAIFDAQIETADAGVLRTASASANFNYGGNRMGLSDMRLSLDDSNLTGSIGMAGDALRFDLDVDDINIDRYLPPSEEQEVEDEGSLDEVDLPIDPLRNFLASGRLDLKSTKFLNLSFSDASFTLEARNGRMTITPSASLYGGSYSGTIGLAVQGESAARLTLVQNFDNLDLMPFARDFMDSDMISGTGDLNLDVSAVGSNLGEMERALAGNVSFAFTDGAWEGFDVWHTLRTARALLDGESGPERPPGEPRTPYSSITASGVVENSILTNRDLNATLPFMSVEGSGTVGLQTNELDLELTGRFIDGPAVQEAPEMAGLVGFALPIEVGGTLDEPSISPQFGAALRAVAEQKVQEEVQEEIEEEREELEERVRDRVRSRLRDLLD